MNSKLPQILLAEQLLPLGRRSKDFRNEILETIGCLENSKLPYKSASRRLFKFLDHLDKLNCICDDIACALVGPDDDPQNLCCRVFYGNGLSESECVEYLEYVRKNAGGG